MRSSRWLRLHTIGFHVLFVAVLVAYAVLIALAAADDDGLSSREVRYLAFFGLVIALLAWASIKPGSEPDRGGGEPTTAIIERVDLPPVVTATATVHQFRPPSPTTYTTSWRKEEGALLHLPQRPQPPAEDGGEMLRSLLREDTGSHPPVGRWGEEAT
jgi:hypothetical protein